MAVRGPRIPVLWMTAKQSRPRIELSAEEMEKLRQLSLSRTEPYEQVTRARILLAYDAGESKSAIARGIGVSRPTVGCALTRPCVPAPRPRSGI